jgi:HSP20 family protein
MEKPFGAMPAVDVTETDGGYEVTAELPGMDEKNIEVKLANRTLTIKGEKRDEKEETKKRLLHARATLRLVPAQLHPA